MKFLTILALLLPLLFSISQFTEGIKLTAIAYEPAANIRAWNCSLCKQFTQVKSPLVFSRQGYQGYVAYQSKDNAILVALRGTENPFDVTKLINDDPEPYPYCNYCYVNSAIYRGWDALRDDILVNLQKVMSLFRQATIISFVGHSLGGAILTFGVPQIGKIYKDQFQIYFLTFGQPRVGNLQFSDHIQNIQKELNVSIFRIVHNADPIPHLPELGFYIHSPKAELWFDQQMNQAKKCSFDKVGQCSNSITTYSNEDHLIDGYMK